MADLVPQLKCALCDGVIDPPTDCYRATGDFLPVGDALRDYCNAPMHWDCYAQWSERERFARHYVDAWVKANRKNPFWWSVYRDSDVYVSVNPGRGIEEASVRLYAVGNDIRVPLPRWPQWLDNVDAITPGLHPFEKKMLDAVLPRLRDQFPDDHAVVHAIDPEEKRPKRKSKAQADA